MAKERAKFESGAAANGVDARTASQIFDLMEKFAEYGFNKSHSAAYALLAYQTAWLKVHYPAEFMAAVLSSDMDKTEKVVDFLAEVRRMGLTMLPPDVNVSSYMFDAATGQPGTIRYGLGAIKGVGRGACEAVVEARGATYAQPYANLYDFCKRVNPAKFNRRTLEALIHSGALDTLADTRASLMQQLPEVLKATEQMARNQEIGMLDMFGNGGAPDIVIDLKTCPEWPLQQKLTGERETLGHYLSGHPLDPYRDELNTLVGHDLGQLDQLWAGRNQQESGKSWRPEVTAFLAGLVVGVRKRGQSQAFVQLEDGRGQLECAFFNDTLNDYAHLLTRDQILIIEGGLREDEFSGGFSLRARRAWDFNALCREHAKTLALQLDLSISNSLKTVERLLAEHRPGPAALRLDLLLPPNSAGTLTLNGHNRP